MRFMRWSQRDYDDADVEMVEEIRDVMREEYERNRPQGTGAPDEDDEDVEY